MLREPAIKLRLLLRRQYKPLTGPDRARRMDAVPKLICDIEPLRRAELHQCVEQRRLTHVANIVMSTLPRNAYPAPFNSSGSA
jgi:hypothetical protein